MFGNNKGKKKEKWRMKGIDLIFQHVRNKKKIEKTHIKEKQSHVQDNIYVIQ